jgi:hypothetical protein
VTALVDPKELFIQLLNVDTEEEVLRILRESGYWETDYIWRPVGDNSNNRAIIGNQQEDAVSALAEKITNSVDAILINKCLEAGIDPRGPAAPKSLRSAIAKFFLDSQDENAGMSRFWGSDRLQTDKDLERVTKQIWLSVTGSAKAPSISIVDRGEGQVPDDFPKTFMALVGYRTEDGKTASQKANIPFVQGQFNMGSSGVFPFASEAYGFQLLISRRNPNLNADPSDRDREWGFTVVRRSEQFKGSVYEYLAPVNATESKYGSVLSFAADQLNLLPESPPRNVPNLVYHDPITYGTLLKLYEYQFKERGLTYGNVLMKSGLMRQLELVLPECGLPVRIVEGRDFKGKPGSFQNNMFGILRRVQQMVARGSWGEGNDDSTSDDSDEVEGTAGSSKGGLKLEGPPVDGDIVVDGVRLPWVAYVFSEDAGDRTRSGAYSLIYHINGQKHAHNDRSFFYPADVGYRYLAKKNQILVLLDCTNLSNNQREKVFKPSRDRLNKGKLAAELQEILKDALKNDSKLQKLQLAVHERNQNARLANKAPVRKVLESLIKSTPSLARFFGIGSVVRVAKPFPGRDSGDSEGESTFEGKKHPTYFRFKGGGTELARVAHIGSRVRLQFETDAVDDYFFRPRDNGVLDLVTVRSPGTIGGSRGELESGRFPYNITIPEEVEVGQEIELKFILADGVIEPLECSVVLTVGPPNPPPGPPGERSKSPSGSANANDLDIRRCHNPAQAREGYDPWPGEEWSDRDAVMIEDAALDGGGVVYYVNCDNVYLRTAQKERPTSDELVIENKFIWSLVLLSLSIIEDLKSTKPPIDGDSESDGDDPIELRDKTVAQTTRAMAQLILPMMEAVGAMTSESLEGDE